MVNPYIGHDSQLMGIEEHRFVGGKGDGLRLYEVHTAAGLDLTAVPDRCCDISRLRYKGVNLSYLSPCGYVAPAFYDKAECVRKGRVTPARGTVGIPPWASGGKGITRWSIH